jgi:hypothetical protein
LSEGLFDRLAPEHLAELKAKLPDWLAEHAAAAVHRIEEVGELDEATRTALLGKLRGLAIAGPADSAGSIAEVAR